MARTVRTKVFFYDELSKAAKQVAVTDNSDINVDYDWWDGTYDDASEVGIKLNGFDLGRGQSIDGVLEDSAKDVAKAIVDAHGKTCGTHITAKAYLKELTVIEVKAALIGADDDAGSEDEIEALDEQFKKDILHQYWLILQREYNYLQSDESIIETIKVNEYEFTEDGHRFRG